MGGNQKPKSQTCKLHQVVTITKPNTPKLGMSIYTSSRFICHKTGQITDQTLMTETYIIST